MISPHPPVRAVAEDPGGTQASFCGMLRVSHVLLVHIGPPLGIAHEMKTGMLAFLGFAVTVVSACAQEPGSGVGPLNDDALAAAASITPADYVKKIGVIAHDSMGGRDTPSPGLEMTASWVATEFERLGLMPSGDEGSYVQRYAIETIRPDLLASFSEVSGGSELRFGRDLLIPLGAAEADVTGDVVVFAGTGTVTSEIGAEVSGKHVVVASSPTGLDRSNFRFAASVLREGALSVLVATDRSSEAWNQRADQVAQTVSVRVGFNGGRSRGLTLEVRDGAIAPILAAHGVDLMSVRARLGGSVIDVPGLTLRLSPRVEVVERDSAPNVVGILKGDDPELRHEYIVFSAHMDHIGVGEPNAQGDSIYNGADDDASGTTAVLELAEAYAELATRPRRSMIFLLVSGEEKGLWGSAHYANNASVSTDRMVANLNADMVGRNWSDTIVVIGKEHSDLGVTLNEVNAAHPELNMTAIDDLWPDERFYYRSDHFNFAQKGVPILFFFNGTHGDYHGLDDEVDRIDADKASRITKLMFFLGYEVANRTERPRWNPESLRQIAPQGS